MCDSLQSHMQAATEQRRRLRRAYVDQFLADWGLHFEALAPSTQQCLDEWARQARLVEDQPSSNFGTVLIQLCKAVESELAAGLGNIPALTTLTDGTLGEKAHVLGKVKLGFQTKQQMESHGIKPGFVVSDLPKFLLCLARLRSKTGSAHGNAEIRSASLQDASRARQLAGQILRGIERNAPQ